MNDGNILAYAALLGAPVVAFILFKTMNVVLAAAITLVGGYMFLPTRPEFDLPVLPAFNKDSITVFAVTLFAMMAIASNRAQVRKSKNSKLLNKEPVAPLLVLPGWLPGNKIAALLCIGVIASGLVTGFFNPEPLFVGGGIVLPGYSMYATASLAMNMGVLILPILIGRRLFAYPEGQKTLLAVLAIGGFVYSFLALVEVRLSPQLNVWIYGFFPHSFGQHMRNGGFRPLVFMNHGLWLAIFLCITSMAAIGAFRARIPLFPPMVWLGIGFWIFIALALSNSLGAFALALLFVPLVLFLPIRAQLLTSALIGLMILSYPVLRERNMVPTDAIVGMAESINPARAQSLRFRLFNEEQLLEHTRSKFVSGWGSYGRNFIWNEDTGRRETVVDGYWIIIFSVGGMLRYLCEYGLLTFAFWQLLFRSRKLSVGPETAVIALILAVNLIDMAVNATNTVITGLLAGALIGRLEVARDGLLGTDKESAGVKRGGRMRHRSGAGGFVPAGAAAHATAADASPADPPADPAATGGDRYSRYAREHSRKETLTRLRPKTPQRR